MDGKKTKEVSLKLANFLTKFGEIMTEITRAESVFDTDLRQQSRELSSAYWRWIRDFASGKSTSDFSAELLRIEFSVFNAVYEDVIKKTFKLISELDGLFFIDTSELNVAIDKAKKRKIEIEGQFVEKGKYQEAIESVKDAVETIFKVYSDWRAQRRNKRRDALKKWGGLLGGVYFSLMVIYFTILNYMQVKPDLILGVGVPAFILTSILGFLAGIFSSE